MASKPMRNAVTEGAAARSWLLGKARQQQRTAESAEPESSDSGGEEDARQEGGECPAVKETRRFSVSSGEGSAKVKLQCCVRVCVC